MTSKEEEWKESYYIHRWHPNYLLTAASIKYRCICAYIYVYRYIVLSTACSWALEGYDIAYWKESGLVLHRLNV